MCRALLDYVALNSYNPCHFLPFPHIPPLFPLSLAPRSLCVAFVVVSCALPISVHRPLRVVFAVVSRALPVSVHRPLRTLFAAACRPSSLSVGAPLCRPLSSPRLVFLPSVCVHCSLRVTFAVLCPLTGSFPSCLSADFPAVRNARRPLSPLLSVPHSCAVHCPLPPLRSVSPLFC